MSKFFFTLDGKILRDKNIYLNLITKKLDGRGGVRVPKIRDVIYGRSFEGF